MLEPLMLSRRHWTAPAAGASVAAPEAARLSSAVTRASRARRRASSEVAAPAFSWARPGPAASAAATSRAPAAAYFRKEDRGRLSLGRMAASVAIAATILARRGRFWEALF